MPLTDVMRIFIFACMMLVNWTTTSLGAHSMDTSESRRGLMFGFNQFPGYYIPWDSHNINEVPFGYNFGFFKEGRRINYRIGINGNGYRRKSPVRIMEYHCGFEVGAEFRILSSKRKWAVNIGLLLYKGWAWSYHYNSPTNSVKYLLDNWGVGPDLLIGRRVNNKWIITTEYSFSVGSAIYKSNGVQYDEKKPATHAWKWFGIGCRYYFN